MFETVAWLLDSSLKMLAAQHELCIMKHKTSRHPHWFALEVRHPHFEDKLISFELFKTMIWSGHHLKMWQPGLLSHSSSLPPRKMQRCGFSCQFLASLPSREAKNHQTKVQHLLMDHVINLQQQPKSGCVWNQLLQWFQVQHLQNFASAYPVQPPYCMLLVLAGRWGLYGRHGTVPKRLVGGRHAIEGEICGISVAYLGWYQKKKRKILVEVSLFEGNSFVFGILGSFRALCSHSK